MEPGIQNKNNPPPVMRAVGLHVCRVGMGTPNQRLQ